MTFIKKSNSSINKFKEDKYDFMKLKIFCTTEELINWRDNLHHMWKYLLTMDAQEGAIICKELKNEIT